jgi:TRAP-type mannitol/chloroaromatic compound transport system substrate-binding protein
MMAAWQPGTLPQKLWEGFAENVKKMSGGRLLIEALPGGSIVAPTESLDAVASGVLDGQQGGTAYWAGKDAAFALLGDLMGGWENPNNAQMWLEYGGGLPLARELYRKYGLHYVGPVMYGVESIPSKKPIRTMAEFKGVKMRAPVGMEQDILKQMGVAPVSLPGSEVYTALERGVVDATDWGTLSMNQDLGYHKLAKYPLYPGFHSMPVNEVSVNLKKWNALPDDFKLIVEVATRDLNRDMVQQHFLADQKVAREAKQLGFEPISWSEADRKKYRDIAQGVWKQWATRSELAKKIHDSQIAFLRQVGVVS